jgi:3-deoxy-D-manno-octulosonic-acid transferase
MMQLLYNLGIWFYGIAIRLFAPFNEKAKLFQNGRKDIFTKLKEAFLENKQEVAWFHCASLGEFEQGRPVIEAFRKEFPQFKILLTFFSPSGYEIRKNYSEVDWIFYLPLDIKSNAEKFVEITKPKVAFFVKYEFWHHYISELNQHQIPIISFSSIFREKQVFFKPHGEFNRQILRKITHFFVQTEKSKQLLASIGISQSTKTGDTRFDRVKQISEQRKEIPIVEKFINNSPTLVLGSIWKADLEVISPVLSQFPKELKIIVAPHEIGDENLKTVEKFFSRQIISRFSNAEIATIQHSNILIIDNIGMLSSLYYYGDFAFIGGAYGAGLHNTLEACVFGLPLFFGDKNFLKFQEAVDLVEKKGAFPIANTESFRQVFTEVYQSQKLQQEIKNRNLEFIEENLGATNQILEYCKKLLK